MKVETVAYAMEDQGVALQVETAGQAVLAALNWNSSPEARQQALAYLESLKAGEVHVLATVAFALVTPDQSSEVRLVGLKLLQHMVRMRWENLNADERRQMAAMAAKLLEESAKPNEPWVLKSQVAALMAEIARREGPSLWNDILPALYTLGSSSALHNWLLHFFVGSPRMSPSIMKIWMESAEVNCSRVSLRHCQKRYHFFIRC